MHVLLFDCTQFPPPGAERRNTFQNDIIRSSAVSPAQPVKVWNPHLCSFPALVQFQNIPSAWRVILIEDVEKPGAPLAIQPSPEGTVELRGEVGWDFIGREDEEELEVEKVEVVPA